jgi:hypothetical protein
MKKLLVLLLLSSSLSTYASQYILTCVGDKEFLTVFSVDEVRKEIIHLSSKSLNSDLEFNDINEKLKIIYWRNKIVNSINYDNGPRVPSFSSFDLENYNYISSAVFFDYLDYSDWKYGYAFNQYFKCIKG